MVPTKPDNKQRLGLLGAGLGQRFHQVDDDFGDFRLGSRYGWRPTDVAAQDFHRRRIRGYVSYTIKHNGVASFSLESRRVRPSPSLAH